MKIFSIFITLLCLILAVIGFAGTDDESATSKSGKTERIYPIAPGVWYPGDGPLPEKPVRYYRVRCWPGCHRGSAYGKYPNLPLNMKPIFPTSAARAKSGSLKGSE